MMICRCGHDSAAHDFWSPQSACMADGCACRAFDLPDPEAAEA